MVASTNWQATSCIWRNVVEVSGTVKDLKELFSGEQLRLLDAVAQALIANPAAFEGASHVAPEASE